WISEALSPDDRAFYADLTARIEKAGLTQHFVFHGWIPQHLMPALYSLGDVTFAIGSYVETFGNVPYESLACGTPSIVARVGPARELLPENLIDKIDPGDTDGAAQIAARIIRNKERTSPATMTYLKTHFQQSDQVAAYADVILNAKKRDLMPYVHRPITDDTHFKRAPWVYRAPDDALYNDLTETYTHASEIEDNKLKSQNYLDGWLIPDFEEDNR
ncbi:MAG: glycosyltransferase, partial [Chloroflexota bacterium]